MTTGNLSGQTLAGEETQSTPLPIPSKPKDKTQFASGRAIQSHCRVVMKEIGEGVLYVEVRERLAKFDLPITRAAFHRNYCNLFGHGPANEQLNKDVPKLTGEDVTEVRQEIMEDTLHEMAEVLNATVAVKPVVSIADPLKDFLRFCMMVESIGGAAKAEQYLDLMKRLGKIL